MAVAPPLTTDGSLTTALASTRAFGERCSNFPPRGLFLKSVAENACQKWGQTALSCQVDGMGAVWEEMQWLVRNFGPLLPWKRKLGQSEGVAYPKHITASMVIQPSSQAVSPVLKFEDWGWASQSYWPSIHSTERKKLKFYWILTCAKHSSGTRDWSVVLI